MECGSTSFSKWGEFLMSDYLVTDTELTSIADAIRTKGGTSADLSFPTGFVSAIEAISGGGLEYEEGTYSTASDVQGYSVTVSFQNSHSTRPAIIFIRDSSVSTQSASSLLYWTFFDLTQLGGRIITNTSASPIKYTYGIMRYADRYSSGGMSDGGGVATSNPPYSSYVYTDKFKLNVGSYLRAGRTYKWIAIWT